jgi:hypothetical protein
MRLHSLKHEKRKKIVLNSKWRQNPRWMPKFVFDIASTEVVFLERFFAFFFLLLLNFYRNKLFSKTQNGARIQDGGRNLFSIAFTEFHLFQNAFLRSFLFCFYNIFIAIKNLPEFKMVVNTTDNYNFEI